MHGSLLPQFRGRAPTNWAVLHGATRTGATLHEMVAQPDAGPIVDQSAVPILPDDTARQVFDKVTVAAEQVLWRSLPGLLAGNAPRLPNDISQGSYYGGRKPEDGRIDWTRSAREVHDLIRAVAPPYPGAFTSLDGIPVRILRSWWCDAPGLPASGSPGAVAVAGGRTFARCGDGRWLELREVQLDANPVLEGAALAARFAPARDGVGQFTLG
jgi:methionyl-tRNA formyltransferase